MVRSATLVSTFRSRLASAPIAQTNYLEDDWNDNKLTNRDNPTDGFFTHPQANEAGDTLIGRYRPEWSVGFGSINVSNGQIDETPTSDSRLDTSSQFVTGSWSIDLHIDPQGTGNDNVQWRVISADDDSNYWQMVWSDDGTSYNITKSDGGSNTNIVSSSHNPTSNTTCKTTRDAYGNFELFESGVSKGTGTDTFLPDPVTQEFDFNSPSDGGSAGTWKFDNLVVV